MGKRERGSSIKKKRKYIRSSIAILLSVFLAFGNISFPVFAEDDIEISTATDAEEIEVTEDAEKVEEAATATEAVEETEIAFNESKTVNGVKVTVSADKGVFPEGSSLFVRAVGAAEEASVENAVEEERSDDVKVASSYTFDIKVLDADGNEIQPDTTKGTVKVSFATAEADNANLTADIYHIDDDMNVDKLDSDTTTEGSKPAVVAETEGFSYYQVEFTYGEMQYVLPGDSEVRLQEILDYVGISGNVTNVYGSNDSLFSAENRDGEWYVIAHQAFSSNEWLKVTLDGVEMDVEILVTDAYGKSYTIEGESITLDDGAYSGQIVGVPLFLNTDDDLSFSLNSFTLPNYSYKLYLDNSSKYYYEDYVNKKTINELFGKKVVLNSLYVDQFHVVDVKFLTPLTVTLDKNGGTGGSDTSWAAEWYLPDIQVPTRSGYSFLGYYDDATGGTRYYKADGTRDYSNTWDKTEDTTLYAHWESLPSTVTLNQNGGTGGTKSVTATYGQNMPSATMPTKTGYTFKGYYDTDASTGGIRYYTETGASARKWDKGGNQTLWARWEGYPYKVHFNGNGSTSGSMSDQNFTYGTEQKLTANAFVRKYTVTYDYNDATGGASPASADAFATFDGWATSSTGNVVYTNQKSVSNLTTTNNGTVNLFAKWTLNSVTLPSPTRTGYVFDGWCTDEGLTNKITGTSYTPTENTTLYASWKEKATVTKAPTGKVNLTYNGENQALLETLGTTSHDNNGTKMMYKVGEGGDWTDTPTGKDYGTYFVYYKAVATNTDEYADGDESANAIEVKIAKATLTITPTSGLTKEYGTTKDITYTVSGLKGNEQQTDVITGGSLTIIPVAPVVAENVGEYYIIENPDDPFTAQNYDFYVTPNVIFTIVKRSTPVTNVKALDDAQKPTVSDLAYTGGELALAVAPTTDVDGYTVWYQLDNGEWKQEIPKATEDGEYTLKVKYVADDNHEPFPEDSNTLTYPVKITVAATIGEQKYGTIEEAVTAWNANGGTLVLQSNASLTSPIALNTTNNKTLDLNGYKINHEGESFAINVSAGSLTVKDSTGGNGKIVSAGPAIYVVSPVSKATSVTIESGTISSTNGSAIVVDTNSNLEVKGGTIAGNNGIDATADANVKVTGGNISGNYNAGIYLSGNATVDVQGGTITSVIGAGIDASDNSAVTILNGTVSSQSGAGIKISDTADATISGGAVSSTSGVGIDINGFNENKLATLNISGGSISSGDKAGIKAGKYSDVNISGGSVTSENAYGLDSSSTTPLEITGDASVGGKGVNLGSDSVIDISNGITSQIPIKVTTASADAPITTGGNYEPKMADYKEIIKAFKLENDGSELTIGVDKNVKAMQSSPYGGITVDGIPVSPANIQYLLPGLSASGVTFTPATDEAPAKLVINGNAEIPEGSELVIPEGMEVTISEGVTLNNNGDIVNNGTLINNGTITGSGDIANNGDITNKGDITTTGTLTNNEGGTITNTIDRTISATVDNSGEVENAGEISGAVTNNENGIVNNADTGVISGDVDNSGRLDNSGEVSGKLDNEAGGAVNNAEGGKLSGDVTNAEDGTVNNAEGGIISGDIDNSGEVENAGEISGAVTNNENGVVNNADTGVISGAVDNSGELDNSGEISGKLDNEAGGVVNNAEGGKLLGDVTNAEDGTVNNAEGGNISGNIDNSGEVNNSGLIEGDITNAENGVVNNAEGASILGDVDNSGLLENDGYVFGAVTNEANGIINNNADAEMAGPVENKEGGVINNAEDGVISGNVDNVGEINNDGTISGGVNNSGELENNGLLSGDVDNTGLLENNGEVTGVVTNEAGATLNNNAGAEISGDVDNSGELNNSGSIVGDITNNAGGLINNNDGGDISGKTNNKEGAVVINNSGASINANVDNAGTLVNAGGKTNADVNNATNGMVVTIPEDALDEFKLNEDGSMTLPAGTTVLVGNTLNELPEGGSIGSDGKLTIITTPEEATNGSSSDDNSSAKPATVKPGTKNGKKVLGNIRGFRAGAIDDGSEDKPKKKSNVKDKDSDNQDVEETADDVEEEVKSQDTDNSDDTNQAKKGSKAYVWWIVIGSILIVGLGFFLFLLFKRRKDDDEEKK